MIRYIALYSVGYLYWLIKQSTKIWKQLVTYSFLLQKIMTIGDQHQQLCTITSTTDTKSQQQPLQLLPPWIPTTMQTTRTVFGRSSCLTISLEKRRDVASDLPPSTLKAVRTARWFLLMSQNKDAGSGTVIVWSTLRQRVGVASRASPATTWPSCPMDRSWELKIRTAPTVSFVLFIIPIDFTFIN